MTDGDKVLFNIPGYIMYNINRESRGGALLVFISDTLTSNIVQNLSFISDTTESLVLKLNIKNKGHFICIIYRNPSGSIPNFLTEIEERILCMLPLVDTVICGGFNLDMLGRPTSSGLNYLSLMDEKNLNFCVTSPTRVATTSRGCGNNMISRTTKTLIDHLWSSHRGNIDTFVLHSALSDHFPICALITIPNANARILLHFRNYSDKKCHKFITEFRNFSVNYIHNNINPNLDTHQLNNELLAMIQHEFPIISELKKTKNLNSPWITKRMLKLIKKIQYLRTT